MAHLIDVSFNRKGAFIANREPAWHGLGDVVDGLDMRQIVEYPGIAFRVELVPAMAALTMGEPGSLSRIPDTWATVRMDTRKAIAAVGDRYEIVQHVDEMLLFDEVFSKQGFEYETAGVLRGGAEVFLVVRNPETFEPAPGDVLKRHLLLNFSYDGKSKTRIKGVETRVVCANTQRIALGEKGGLDFGIIHTASAADKLQDVRNALLAATGAFKAHESDIKVLLGAQPNRDEVIVTMQSAILSAFGNQPAENETKRLAVYRDKVDTMQQSIAGLLNSPNCTVGGIKGTSWALYNAISEWADHEYAKGVRGSDRAKAENRFLSIIGGRANEVKQVAWNTLLKAAVAA